MKQIQKLCDEEWAQTGWQAHDEAARDYPIWHEAFIAGFKIARQLAVKAATAVYEDKTRNAVCRDVSYALARLGEENV